MSRDTIYRMVFEEIKESIEWGLDCKDGSYSHYVDGVTSLGQRMLDELDNTKEDEGRILTAAREYLEKQSKV